MSWSEDRLHRWLQGRSVPRVLKGRSGHDAAVLAPVKGRSVMCADQCVEGVHFETTARGRDVGRKAVNRALSDLAATGAEPRSVLLTIAASQQRPAAWLKAVIEGASAAAEAVGASLVGGDLSSCPAGAVIAAFAHGELPGKSRPVGRDRARAGQRVVLTGPVGGSRLGRHLRFLPRIEAGKDLVACGASAMMDVSDGLAWDLHRLARHSAVRIELEFVPIHRDARRQSQRSGRSALDHGLHDGEDHELIACLAPGKCPEFAIPIGRVVSGEGLWLTPAVSGQARGRRWKPSDGGWKHGPDRAPSPHQEEPS